LCIDIGGGSTEVAGAVGDRPTKLWSVAIGSVRLTEIFKSNGDVSPKQLRLLREFAREAVEESLPAGNSWISRASRSGSSGSIRTVIACAAAEGTAPRDRRTDLACGGKAGPYGSGREAPPALRCQARPMSSWLAR
jgi:exopolyphosphatase/pppGpp-phosphohydrolase